MVRSLVFLFGFVFVILAAEGNYEFTAKEIAEEKSQRAQKLVSSSHRSQDALQKAIAESVWHPQSTSFARPSTTSKSSIRDGGDYFHSRLEVHSVLAHKQSAHRQVRKVRDQMDARLRPYVCLAEAGFQEPEEVKLELCRLERSTKLGSMGLSMGRVSTVCPTPQPPAEGQYTQEEKSKQEEGQSKSIWTSYSRATMVIQLFRGTFYPWRRGGVQCHAGETGDPSDCAPGIPHYSDSFSAGNHERVLHASAIYEGAQGGCGQDGQSAQEAQRGGEGALQHAFFLEAVHSRFSAAMDSICREVWSRRSRACRQSQSSQREVAESQGGRRQQEGGLGGAGRGGAHRHLGRRDGGQGGCRGEHSSQLVKHGSSSAGHAREGRRSHCGSWREQKQETTNRRARQRTAWWRWLPSICSRCHELCDGAFWQARQVDCQETCLWHQQGPSAALLNWGHSFVYEPEFLSPWAASFRGLDLAWEMGTIWDVGSNSFVPSLKSDICQRRRRRLRRVHFAERIEFYVGFEDSTRWACRQAKLCPLQHQPSLRALFNDPYADAEVLSEDDDASDEVSWMSASAVPVDHDSPPVSLNRAVTRIADLPEVAHQEDEIGLADEADSQCSSSGDETSHMQDVLDQEVVVPPEVRHSTLVYFFDFDPVHCRPRWTNYDVLHEDIAEESDMSPHDVSRIHVVGHPPNDLKMANIYPVIAQQPQDISEGSTFQMILLDVEFHNALPSLDPEVVRRVKLLPMTVSRKALFAILGLQPYCNYAKKQCLLWHNRNPVKVQQRALLDLRHGDYVRIAVPPARGELRKYYTREVAQCFRRGYRASNIPVLLEAYPAGFPVEDMPVYDTFSYVPRAEDLDYDRDALALFQIESFSIPPFDPWPVFLKRCAKFEAGSFEMKAGENDRMDPPSFATDQHRPPQVPPPDDPLMLRFGNEAGFLQDLRPFWEHFAAAEVEEEGRVLYVQTWYADHERFPRCDSSRAVRLTASPWDWAEKLAEAWDDRVDPDNIIDLYMIQPRPRSTSWTDDEAVPHILLLQNPHPARRSIHIFSVDTSNPTSAATSFVTSAPFPLRKVDFFDILGIADRSMISSLVDCAVWHGDIELDHVQQYPNRHGASFIVILNHLRDIIHRAAAANEAASSSSTSLLQVASVRKTIELATCIDDVQT